MARLQLGDIVAEVEFKDIKNVHLSVNPPSGRVHISAPTRMSLDIVRVFAISKLSWIRQQQKSLRQQARETPREYLPKESHYVWGKRYLLRVREHDAPPFVELTPRRLSLQVRTNTNREKRAKIVEKWYRHQVRNAAQPLIAKWERKLGVKVERLYVQRMKTRWGSCNSTAGTIRLNSELGKKPRECLEYIVVHEMVHLLEPTHNARFVALMDRYMPHWQFHRATLNRLPVRREEWMY